MMLRTRFMVLGVLLAVFAGGLQSATGQQPHRARLYVTHSYFVGTIHSTPPFIALELFDNGEFKWRPTGDDPREIVGSFRIVGNAIDLVAANHIGADGVLTGDGSAGTVRFTWRAQGETATLTMCIARALAWPHPEEKCQ